jgi:hypothetical protein
MSLITFTDWIIARESSASTRARHDAALGLKPLAVIGSLHGRSTASPFETKSIEKKAKKKPKKKRKTVVKNSQLANWIKEAEALKKELEDLKQIKDKKAREKPVDKKAKEEPVDKKVKEEPVDKSEDLKDKKAKEEPVDKPSDDKLKKAKNGNSNTPKGSEDKASEDKAS